MKSLSIAAGLVLLLQFSSYSQPGHWQVTLSDGAVISCAGLDTLNGDTLVVSVETVKESVPADSIVEIRLVRSSTFADGSSTGSTVGAILGLLGGAIFSKPGGGFGSFSLGNPWIYRPISALGTGLGLGIVGYVIGGIVGAILGIDEVYDLSQLTHAGKLTAILGILHNE